MTESDATSERISPLEVRSRYFATRRYLVIRALFGFVLFVALSACADDPGNAACIGVGTEHDTSTCISTFSRCDDGRGYDLKCDGGKCQCLVDNKVVKTAKATDCSTDRSVVNAACGWELR